MSRIDSDLLERIETYAHRVADVADTIERMGKSRRVVDQLYGSGSSVGANCFEADEAVSRKDFCRSLGISIKELSETRFWLRFAARRAWIPEERLAPLLDETRQLKSILGAMHSRTRRNDQSS